jgi:outer membrane protein
MKRVLTVVFSVLCLQGFSQQKLSLTDAISVALKNSFDIQIARNNLEISTINNNVGVAGKLPVVTGTINDNQQLTTINQKFSDPSRDASRSAVGSNNLSLGVTGSILLFNGWRVVATKKRLEELERQNQQMLNAEIQNTIAAVMTQYYEVVRQMELVHTLRQSISVSQQRLDLLKVRKEVGLSNNADLFQAQLDLTTLEQNLKGQDLIISQAITTLQNLMSVKPDTTVLITDTVIVIDRNINLDTVRNAMMRNPQILAAAHQVNVSEFIEKEVTAQRYPTVRATTGYNFQSSKSAAGFSLLNQSFGPFLGVNVAIPIYNGGIFKRQQRVAEINTKNATLLRDNLVIDFEASAMRSYQIYTNTLDLLNTQQQNYTLARQLLDLVMQRIQLGQGTIVDARIAQESFETEGYRLVNLNYAAKIAEIEMKRLANQLALP